MDLLEEHPSPSVTHILEGLVDWSKPADIGAGREENEPDDGHPKVGGSSSPTHPGKATNQIDSQCGTVYCKSTDSMFSADHP